MPPVAKCTSSTCLVILLAQAEEQHFGGSHCTSLAPGRGAGNSCTTVSHAVLLDISALAEELLMVLGKLNHQQHQNNCSERNDEKCIGFDGVPSFAKP